jgi:hypothetical protein
LISWNLDLDSSESFLRIISESDSEIDSELKEELIKENILNDNLGIIPQFDNVNDALKFAIHKKGYLNITLQHFSMTPTIKENDLLQIISINSIKSLAINDIVAFFNSFDQKIIVHRIIKIVGEKIYCVGDNPTSKLDPPIIFDQVLGKVIAKKSFWDEDFVYLEPKSFKLIRLLRVDKILPLCAKILYYIGKIPILKLIPYFYYQSAINSIKKDLQSENYQVIIRGSLASEKLSENINNWTPGFSDIDLVFVTTDDFLTDKNQIFQLINKISALRKIYPMILHYYYIPKKLY